MRRRIPVLAIPGPGRDGGFQVEGNGGAREQEAQLELTVTRAKWSTRRGRLIAWTNCSMTCRPWVRGRLRANSTTAGTRRVAGVRWTARSAFAPGPHRIRLRIPRSIRAWMRQTPGHEHLRARLRFSAVGLDGERDTVRRAVRHR